MNQTKPARRYFVRAVRIPAANEWHAEFGFPGGHPDFVQESGRRVVYDNEGQAVADAGETMCDLLNSRKRQRSKPERYRRMTGPEVAVALADLEITPTAFAWLYGTSQDRVLKWIDTVEDIPHPVRVLLATLALPGALITARQTTSSVTTERHPNA